MAYTINVAGAALVRTNTGNGGALENLGYTINGAEVEFIDFVLPVHVDDMGGEDGPPADVIQMGEIAIVRLTLSKWDPDVADRVIVRAKGATTVGVPIVAGTLMFATAYYYRLLIHSPLTPFNFPRAFPRGSISINKGTRHSLLQMEWECHKDVGATGVLWNTSTV